MHIENWEDEESLNNDLNRPHVRDMSSTGPWLHCKAVANKKVANYLDVTLDLAKGEHRSYI